MQNEIDSGRHSSQSQLRATIEAFAAKQAANNVSNGADTDTLLDAFEHLQAAAAKRAYRDFFHADLDLHRAIVKLADIPSLEEAWECVSVRYRKFHWNTLKTCWPDLNTLFEGHRTIVDAICEGNSTLAEYSASMHHQAVWYRLEQQNNTEFLSRSALERATAYVSLHMDQPIRLEHVAKEICHTNPGHLSRLFRQKYGISFQAFVQQLRMRQAAAMLTQGKIKISQVAGMVGYKDASRFAQHFYKHFGVLPSKFINKDI